VELAKIYSAEGADELVFLDISATEERRKTLVDLVRKVASTINIPFTVWRNFVRSRCGDLASEWSG
jgi:cyclase